MNKKFISFVAALLCLSLTACQPAATGASSSSQPAAESPSSQPATPTYARTVEADVVIVGAGGAGMATALEAVKNGANSVAIIEKLTFTGGSLNTTSGTMSGAETIIQELDGLKDSNKSYYDDIVAEGSKNGGKPNLDLVNAYIESNTASINWLWEMGLKDRTFTTDKEGKKSVFAPEHTLYSFPRSYKAKPQDATKYKSSAHEILDTQLAANSDKITVYYQTEAKHLLPNDKGQILWVDTIDLKTNESVKFEATKGVVVCTGGYSANPTLMSHFNPITASVIAGGLPTANGYGLYMMQEVGASLVEESMGWVPSFPGGRENPDAPGTGSIAPVYVAEAGGIFVNKDGQRYINETDRDNVKREVALDEQGYHYEIFTDTILADLAAAKRDMMWKFLYEPVKGKFVLEAATLEELAAKMEIPADAFVKTVADYNAAVAEGKTDALGRNYFKDENPNNKSRNKIEGSKFYAVKMRPLAIVTVGGISANADMQVLDANGKAIPGLYAAGECVQVWGSYISSGTGVMGPITFGRIAGTAVMTKELGEGYVAAPAANLMDIKLFDKQKSSTAVMDLSNLKDGKYQGTVDGQEGPMTVEVEVAGGKLTSVRVLSNAETLALAQPALDTIPSAIVEAGSLDIDAVTGATLTSNRIIKAVEQALATAK